MLYLTFFERIQTLDVSDLAVIVVVFVLFTFLVTGVWAFVNKLLAPIRIRELLSGSPEAEAVATFAWEKGREVEIFLFLKGLPLAQGETFSSAIQKKCSKEKQSEEEYRQELLSILFLFHDFPNQPVKMVVKEIRRALWNSLLPDLHKLERIVLGEPRNILKEPSHYFGALEQIAILARFTKDGLKTAYTDEGMEGKFQELYTDLGTCICIIGELLFERFPGNVRLVCEFYEVIDDNKWRHLVGTHMVLA